MGLPPFYQNAGLDWLRGFPFPPPPQQWWLALHRALPAQSANQAGGRLLLNRDEWSTSRPASRSPLPQEPWVPGDGSLLEITNYVDIAVGPMSVDEHLFGFSLWDQAVDGMMLVNGVLQESVIVNAGDVFVFRPEHLLVRFTSP
jgi:hypothetical protein